MSKDVEAMEAVLEVKEHLEMDKKMVWSWGKLLKVNI